jgi:hypothetical protein
VIVNCAENDRRTRVGVRVRVSFCLRALLRSSDRAGRVRTGRQRGKGNSRALGAPFASVSGEFADEIRLGTSGRSKVRVVSYYDSIRTCECAFNCKIIN